MEHQLDPVASIAAAAIEHMNSDHADAVLAYARGLGGIHWAQAAVMTGLSAHGIDLTVSGDGRVATVHIPFIPPLSHANQLRPRLVAMAQQARDRLAAAGDG